MARPRKGVASPRGTPAPSKARVSAVDRLRCERRPVGWMVRPHADGGSPMPTWPAAAPVTEHGARDRAAVIPPSTRAGRSLRRRPAVAAYEHGKALCVDRGEEEAQISRRPSTPWSTRRPTGDSSAIRASATSVTVTQTSEPASCSEAITSADGQGERVHRIARAGARELGLPLVVVVSRSPSSTPYRAASLPRRSRFRQRPLVDLGVAGHEQVDAERCGRAHALCGCRRPRRPPCGIRRRRSRARPRHSRQAARLRGGRPPRQGY